MEEISDLQKFKRELKKALKLPNRIAKTNDTFGLIPIEQEIQRMLKRLRLTCQNKSKKKGLKPLKKGAKAP